MPKPWLCFLTFLVATLSTILLFSSHGPFQPTFEIKHGLGHPSPIISPTHLIKDEENRVALSFGRQISHQLSKPTSQVKEQQAARAKRAYPNTLSYQDALCNGRRYWALIQAGNPNPPHVTQGDFDNSGWTLNEGYPKVIDDDLKTPIAKLGISSNTADIYRAAAQQFSSFTNQNGQHQDVRLRCSSCPSCCLKYLSVLEDAR